MKIKVKVSIRNDSDLHATIKLNLKFSKDVNQDTSQKNDKSRRLNIVHLYIKVLIRQSLSRA